MFLFLLTLLYHGIESGDNFLIILEETYEAEDITHKLMTLQDF